LYPHEGKVVALNAGKAAAVVAVRAAELTTTSMSFGHLVKSIPTRCGEACDASPIKENDPNTRFQLVYPVATNRCEVLGNDPTFGESLPLSQSSGFVWIVWRLYSGCPNGDGIFLSKTIIN
jgi:hypothetical protein